ncbi:hypothetical protein HZB02_03635 [Candidatus Woesearchaeota archaeon]|nr:hypothetical protein [Candidatus Woesearchaeota archaeon]
MGNSFLLGLGVGLIAVYAIDYIEIIPSIGGVLQPYAKLLYLVAGVLCLVYGVSKH